MNPCKELLDDYIEVARKLGEVMKELKPFAAKNVLDGEEFKPINYPQAKDLFDKRIALETKLIEINNTYLDCIKKTKTK